MRRSTLLRLLALLPFPGARAWAQREAFPGKHETTLRELAAAVLPASLGRAGTDNAATQFARWVQQYRPGAELQTGYGFTRIRRQGASPAGTYLKQLEEIAATVLGEGSVAGRRKLLAKRLANVKDLTMIPDGSDVVADLMSFYFGSSAANDLAYEARIGRDLCRGLERSGDMPVPLQGGGRGNV